MLTRRSLLLSLAAGLVALAACDQLSPPPDDPVEQTITFGELADRFVDAPPFELQATASSGLPVVYAAEGVCSVNGVTATLDGVPGTCTLTASQPGNDDYLATPDVQRSFEVLERPDPSHAIGFVLFSEARDGTGPVVDASGTFVAREGELPAALVDLPDPGLDGTCDVIGAGGGGGATPIPDPTGTAVSAGTPLTAKAQDATYASLTSPSLGMYQLAAPPASALPVTGLTLDVPGGDDVPVFQDAPFPDTVPYVWSAGFDPDAVTTATTFTWESGDPKDLVLLIGGDGATVFSCLAADDGSFAFDQATIDALDAAGFTAGAVQTAGRLAIEPTVQQGAALLLGVLRLTSDEPAAAVATASTDVVHLLRLALPAQLEGREE